MFRHFASTVCALLLSCFSTAQTSLDSAEVSAYRLSCPEKLVPGVVYSVDSAQLNAFASPDISRAINTIPGVKMETRGEGGSRRIQVRGSSLRSKYSIRNSMLIFDGFILTEADGNSPIEWLDPSFISNINLVTGPAAASYGGAYGGAFIVETIESKNDYPSTNSLVNLSTTGREFSLTDSNIPYSIRATSTYSSKFDGGNFSLSGIYSENSGYRDWEWNEKIQGNLKITINDNKGGKHTGIAGYYEGRWALPGAISEADALTSPTFSPGAQYNAHVDRTRIMAGYKYETTLKGGSKLTSSVLARTTQKTNPYGTTNFYNGYKEEDGRGISFLSSIIKRVHTSNNYSIDAEATVMHINDSYNLNEWDYESNGVAYNPREDIDFKANSSFVSTSLIFTNVEEFRVEAQIGVSHRRRDISGSIFESGIATPYDSLFDPNPTYTTFLPRLGFSYLLNNKSILYFQASSGFSDPTSFELTEPAFDTNNSLKSENAGGVELGIRSQITEKLFLNSTLYHQVVNDAIMQFADSNDVQLYTNVNGGLTMSGFEQDLTYRNNNTVIRTYAALTHNVFGPDSDNDGDFIPGTPQVSFGSTVRYNSERYNLALDYRHIGETYLMNDNTDDDGNTYTLDAYNVLDISVGSEIYYDMYVEVGVKNVLNAKYTNWANFNGKALKFFNPAPPTTAFVTLRRLF